MKKLLLASLLFLSSFTYAEMKDFPVFDMSGGLYTNDQPERIEDKYSPDLLNVWLDRDTGVVKRQGYVPYLASAITSLKPIRRLYEMRFNNGNRYMIINSSASVYYSQGVGDYTSILAGQSLTATDNYTSGLNVLLRDNGTTAGKWDGTTYTAYTVANSTDMVYGKYHIYFKDHWFKAGVSGYLSSLYWSVVNDPGDFGSYGSGAKFVGANDGDVITGLFPWQNMLIITKKYSVYALMGSDPQTWLVVPLNIGVGCLYGSTIANYKGYPMWLSARGIESFDGVNVNLMSLPMDNFMKALPQLQVNSQSIVQDTASDWGAGTGVNIDTTTTAGSVGIKNNILDGFPNILGSYSGGGSNNFNYPIQVFSGASYADNYKFKFRQSFTVPYNGIIYKTISVSDSRNSSYTHHGYSKNIYIKTSTGGIIASALNQSDGSWVTTFNGLKLSNNATYYFEIHNVYADPFADITFCEMLSTSTLTTNSTNFMQYYNAGTWHDTSYHMGIGIAMVYNTASFTTQALNAGSSFGSWGSISIDDTKPTGSSISYYVQTSTASNNRASRPYYPVSNGSTIPSTVGGYAWITSSFTRTDATADPLLNKLTLNYYTNTGIEPHAIIYKEGYWLFCSTNTTTTQNNVVLHYDKYGRFTLHNNMTMDSACLFKDNLYTGSSGNTGQIYKQEAGVYTDNGTAFPSYYCTKVFDCALPGNQKAFRYFYFHTKNSGNWNMYSKFRLDGSSGDFTDLDNISLTGNSIVVKKVNFPNETNAFYMQLKFGNDTASQYFSTRGLDLIYDPYPFQ